jgi:hypothetical protein
MENDIEKYLRKYVVQLTSDIQPKIAGKTRIDVICALLSLTALEMKGIDQDDAPIVDATSAIYKALDTFMALGAFSVKFREKAETDGN